MGFYIVAFILLLCKDKKEKRKRKTVTLQILAIIPKDTLIRQLMQPQSVTYTF